MLIGHLDSKLERLQTCGVDDARRWQGAPLNRVSMRKRTSARDRCAYF